MAAGPPYYRSRRECSFRSLSAPILTRLLSPVRRALMLGAAATALAAAQGPPPPSALHPAPSDSAIRIVLLTIGQGSQVYEMFGHNAIWVHDPSTATDFVYNWGVFDFRTQGFLVRFLRGDMRYTMDAQTIGNTLAYYKYLNRRMWAQELDLTVSEKRALVDYIRWNYLPQNRQYRYNYYLDNCSTRVRDVIDRVLGGRLREYLRGIPTDQTYRSHSLRLMQSAPLLVTGVEIALGRSTDTPLSADQASFLPVQLMDHLRNFKLDGGARALVAREWMLSDADRGPEPSNVPALWKALLPIGLVLAGVILGLWLVLHARISTAVVVAIVAGLVGIIGTILVLLVAITDHVAAHGNENLWILNPVWLVVAVALPRAMLKGAWGPKTTWIVWIGAGLSVCAMLMHLVGLSRQPNWDVIALLLPAQLAMAEIVRRTQKSNSR
jgi:hypothetical protein